MELKRQLTVQAQCSLKNRQPKCKALKWTFIGTTGYETRQLGPFPAVMLSFITALKSEGREYGSSPVQTIGDTVGVGVGVGVQGVGQREEERVERGPNRDVCTVSSFYAQEVN